MAWNREKTDNGFDLVWNGVETGIAASPLKGTANLQNVNIATETGEAMVSYGRAKQNQPILAGGTLTASVGDGAVTLAGPSTLQSGQWINITATDIAPTTLSVDYLVVAGGGGASGGLLNTTIGGGGGAGGMKTGTTTVTAGTAYTITVGAGGAGGTSAAGTNGSNSSLGALVVSTGGGGGGFGEAGAGVAGGSGGGGGSEVTGGAGGAASPAGQGNAGGVGFGSGSASERSSGGGGGAGAVGGAGIINAGGAGGVGSASSISGSSVTYAAGGAGWSNTQGSHTGAAGTANRGNGGNATLTNPATAGGAGGSGIVIISYVTGTLNATGGTITTSGGNTIHTFTTSGTFTVTSPAFGTGTYYVSYKNSSNKFKLSWRYDPNGLYYVQHGTSGTATFTVTPTLGKPIAKATEIFQDENSTEYRYYVLDENNYVWVYDTKVYATTLAANGVGMEWFLPDDANYSPRIFTGLAILNGWVHVISDIHIMVKPTVDLGKSFEAMSGVSLMNISDSTAPLKHFAYVGHQGKLYYTDKTYIGEIFPTTSLETGIQNLQSYCRYTVVTDNITLAVEEILSGSGPVAPNTGVRMPAVFFTDEFGTLPTAITAGTVYYIYVDSFLDGEYNVYAAASGGSPLDIEAGASGLQYFNTYYPIGAAAFAGANPLMTWSGQRVNLPSFETAISLTEVGNTVLIGCKGNVVYPWNQIDTLPSGLITLPEADVQSLLTVNQMGYIFAGHKGNIYITDGSVASLLVKVPDYCAGVPGTIASYYEPTFDWGDTMYLRGRVYFSILDQTSTKAGNCGGVWSFYPTQNLAYGQDTGLALRLENQSSYGTYSGVCTVLLANEVQTAISPQYWSGWYSSISAPVYGIDYNTTLPTSTAVIETDLLSTGTILEKDTFSQIEYKLSTQLDTNDTVQVYWRTNSTDAWTSSGTVQEESGNRISGLFQVNFQKTQWVQFRVVLTSSAVSTTTLCRLVELRFR